MRKTKAYIIDLFDNLQPSARTIDKMQSQEIKTLKNMLLERGL